MQIRLTVLGPRGGRAARGCDVLVTAPEGTPLGKVAGALASAAGTGQPGGRSASAAVVLYAGAERLPPTAVLGAPPLVDGALLSLHAPAEQHGEHGPYGRFGQYGRPPAELARLRVVGGPDAGGVHLLQGGQARIGRSADADVPLDDPDVSRLHCEIAVGADGQITVADLESTNGTALAGRAVGPRPVPFTAGALLQIGESTLRLDPPHAPAPSPLASVPDGDGHLRVALRDDPGGAVRWTPGPGPGAEPGTADAMPAADASGAAAAGMIPGQPAGPRGGGSTATGSGTVTVAGREPGAAAPGAVPAQAATGAAGTHGSGGRWSPHEGPAADPYDPPDPYASQQADRAGRRAATPQQGVAPPRGRDHGTGDGTGGGAGADGRRETGERARPGAEAGRARGVGAIGAWARRRFTGARGGPQEGDAGESEALRERWPDPAAVLLTALGPGRRLWERGPAHPDALTVRLGTADLPSEDGTRRLAAVPFTVDLRAPGSAALTLAGPRPRLSGLARAVLAQLCALHSPATLEVVLLSADRTRAAESRAEEWSWLNWLPHLRPAHGQDCRLLLAFDREQAEARTAEVVRRLEDGPLGPSWAAAPQAAVAAAAAAHHGTYTLLVVDGDPGSAALRETVARVAETGPSAGVHVLCLAEAGERPAIAHGVVARLSGDVATTLSIETAGHVVEPDDEIVLDAVSADWAEHFARALAPLREADAEARGTRSRYALPGTVRLLDELDLALATPAKIGARWAEAPPAAPAATAVLGVGPQGRIAVDLVTEGPHALIGGAQGSGKTELLRSFAAALAAAERPERLALILVDGAGQERGEGLTACADLPHVSAHLVASDPVRMREFAQALTAELRQRAELLGDQEFGAWHAESLAAPTVPRQAGSAGGPGARAAGDAANPRPGDAGSRRYGRPAGSAGDPGSAPLPRLVIVVDDLDALVAPALGAPGRPSAGSVVRALEAVARDGERLGVHLVAATGRPERTAGGEADERARIRIALRMADPESAALMVHVEDPAGLDDALPGRGYLRRPGGAVTVFQTGRVSARIPRTATLRPTVVALEWDRMGDPPARRQVRELGNGPTDLALLASALQRAAEAGDPERTSR
ncbi:FtsK/SpoIIIE domain-containing protein [Streptomyces sp. V4-01]|uniref:FtsK/SpoIIIE domain-containing protein n=1 Tax=Actinacidiphila polyblastidii TaxID=3110430 RepID=A0ABU7P8W8_9ACTN|nr:FtsK/SpoIIIE domain-containing protein [Streptomyces sp. V4-01]